MRAGDTYPALEARKVHLVCRLLRIVDTNLIWRSLVRLICPQRMVRVERCSVSGPPQDIDNVPVQRYEPELNRKGLFFETVVFLKEDIMTLAE